MNKLSKRITLSLAALAVTVLTGCSNLNTVIPDEVKYGQLYSLNDALYMAKQSCDNEDSLFLVKHWAMIVHPSLTDHLDYIEENKQAHFQGKRLVKQLGYLSGNYGEPSCANIAEAGRTTSKLIAALTGQPLQIASR